ncbi:MAG: hypothetical protein R3Y67_06705 [Eubacteriales bacterium]
MLIRTDEEYDDAVDLETLFNEDLIKEDMEQLALLTLYTTYQMTEVSNRAEIVLKGKGAVADFTRNMEMRQNTIDRMQYNTLCFYMGDFKTPYHATKNPTGSLGWTGKYVREGVHLFLLYLYDQPLPSKAAKAVANQIGFSESSINIHTLSFEKVIMDESEKYQVNIFWNYFQRWKQYFPMEREEKMRYLKWLEKIIYSRADAIVSGQFRRHYGSVAVLLAMLSQIKLQMGEVNADKSIFAIYKKKFPRHSSFQADMKEYFEMW